MTHSDNLDGTFSNPLIFADYPDPDIIAVGEDFYLASSSFTVVPGIPICHSTDLVNWRVIGHAYDRLPSTNPAYGMKDGSVAYRGGSWAPSIRHYNGKFYVCFCTPAEGFFMCIADRPQGPYEMTGFGTELYDPSLFFDDDGRVYVAHGANGLCITELTPDARAIRSGPVNIHQTAFGTPMEGSHLYKRNAWYYLCVTSRGYNGIQIVMRARHLLGPWDWRVISADDMNYANAGLHQGGFVETTAGETWFFMFQDRDWLGRVPILQPVRWVEDWPTLGDPNNYGKAYVTAVKPKTARPEKPHLPEGSDHFDAPRLGLQWQWNHNPDDARWSLSARPGFLRLHASAGSDLMHARNTLTQKMVGPESTGTASVDVSNLNDGDIAGLAALNYSHAFVGVTKSAGQWSVLMVNEGKTVASTQIKTKPTTILLQAHANADGIANFAWSTDGSPFSPIGDTLAMQFTVRTFLGNRFGLFCFTPPGQPGGGFADFDAFDLEPAGPAHRFSAFNPIRAVDYDDERGTDTQRPQEKAPRQFLFNIDDGDYVVFNQIDFGEGATSFTARVSSITKGGSIQVHLDSLDTPPIGACPVPGVGNTDSWNGPFTEEKCAIKPSAGMHRVYLRFIGPGRNLMRVDWFGFQA